MSTSLPQLPELPALPSLYASAQDTSTQSNPQTQQNTFGDLITGIGRAFGAVSGSTVDPAKLAQASQASGAGIGSITWPRIAAFIVGLIMIAGGLLLFKQTQVVIQTGAKGAARLAAL